MLLVEIPSNIELLLGPPGTGKTTQCIKLVEEALESGMRPEEIAYSSFSRAAAQEAMNRAVEKFGLNKDRFLYFRTLHSIAFRLLGLKKTDVMNASHFRKMGKLLEMEFTASVSEHTEQPPATGAAGDICLKLVSLARATRTPLEDTWKEHGENIAFFSVAQFNAELENYKLENSLLDFTDFLDECQKSLQNVKFFILDEAQDLTRQQWEFFFRLAKYVPRIVIAGDDDQAIYQWAGADVETFLHLKEHSIKQTVLPVSYRLPKNVHALANRVVTCIENRYPKQFESTKEEGEVFYEPSLESMREIDLSQGSWLFLARNQCFIPKLEHFILDKGFVYKKFDIWSNQFSYIKAVVLYENLRKGKVINLQQAQLVMEYSRKENKITKPGQYTFKDLFPELTGEEDWMTTMGQLSWEEREYIRSLRQNGESLIEPGRIRISTIHAAKGAEADNVVLYTGATKKVMEQLDKDKDPELRVWYVGITRAKKTLYVVGDNELFDRF